MKLLAIKNNGLICEEDLFLIGSSTKRDDNTKIGMFGSGWKYALAWLLRNDCGIQIFSGNEEIKIGVEKSKHRDKDVNIITVNDKRTSLTTEMGPDWTAWMAFREIVSNAIDEGGFEYELDASVSKSDDTTTVYISANEDILDMFNNFDNYFSFNREGGIKVDGRWDRPIGTIYLKEEPSDLVVYRKGIRCYNNSEYTQSMFDIDIDDLDINESRLAEIYDIRMKIKNAFSSTLDYEMFIKMLFNHEKLVDAKSLTHSLEEHFKKAIKDGTEFASKTCGLLESNIGKVVISTSLYDELSKKGIVRSIWDLFNVAGAPEGFKYTESTFDEEGVKLFLVKFNIAGITFHVGDFNLERFTTCRVHNKDVYINSKTHLINEDVNTIALEILAKANADFFKNQLIVTVNEN